MSGSKRIVIIGGDAAGMSAASRAKRGAPQLQITVLEKGEFVSYGACGIPYYIAGFVDSHHELQVYDADFFRKKRGIDIKLLHEATKIYPNEKTVSFTELDSGRTGTIGYDKLLISTGCSAVRPMIKGVESEGVFTIRNLSDGIAIKDFIKNNSPRTAALIGAGPVNLEMAWALTQLGMDVSLVERGERILPLYSDECRNAVEKQLEQANVRLHTSTALRKIDSQSGRVTGVSLENGDTIDADICIIGAGVRPNTDFARDAGIAVGRSGGILVNERMETNVPDVYAAGDCCETYHRILKRNVFLPLATTANKQGKVAGDTMAGKNSSFAGITGTSVFKCFYLEIGKTGLSGIEASREGFNCVSSTITQLSRAEYYPGTAPITVTVTAEKNSGRLLGAHMVGTEGVAKRIDVFAAALYAGMNLSDISALDLSYAPPFAPVWDPIIIAVNELAKKIGGT